MLAAGPDCFLRWVKLSRTPFIANWNVSTENKRYTHAHTYVYIYVHLYKYRKQLCAILRHMQYIVLSFPTASRRWSQTALFCAYTNFVKIKWNSSLLLFFFFIRDICVCVYIYTRTGLYECVRRKTLFFFRNEKEILANRNGHCNGQTACRALTSSNWMIIYIFAEISAKSNDLVSWFKVVSLLQCSSTLMCNNSYTHIAFVVTRALKCN